MDAVFICEKSYIIQINRFKIVDKNKSFWRGCTILHNFIGRLEWVERTMIDQCYRGISRVSCWHRATFFRLFWRFPVCCHPRYCYYLLGFTQMRLLWCQRFYCHYFFVFLSKDILYRDVHNEHVFIILCIRVICHTEVCQILDFILLLQHLFYCM